MDILLRDLDAELLQNHRNDTELFASLNELQRTTGIVHAGEPICPFLRPYFMPRTKYAAICAVANTLSHAFDRLTLEALENEALMSTLGMSEDEERWARIEPGYSGVTVNSRLDAFLCPDGFAFLEYNAENPAGIGDQSSLETLFRGVPEVVRFLDRNAHKFPQPRSMLLKALDAVYREFGGKKAKPGIAIVDWDGVSTGAEFNILREHFLAEGYPCEICDPTELEYDGKSLRWGEFVIDIFFKRVIIHEFIERFGMSHPLYQACMDGAVCMANSFRSKIPHKKSGFAILSDPQYGRLFTAGQLEAISHHIPWTRIVQYGNSESGGEQVDLVEFIRRERHRFVLKPNDDYGGHGIHIGWESTESEWDDAIEAALATPYVVQERVVVELCPMPVFSGGEAHMESLLVDFDPFLFRGSVEGGMVRLSARTLVNISQGGGESALVILDDL